VTAIPLEQIRPHPRLSFRFTYEVHSIAESIRSSVDDENSPNGQLNPGRVVRRIGGDGGYYVYVGVRRYLALRLLHESTKDERFDVYNAYVDEGLSELQMFVRAKAENEDERGERQGLSIMEQASGLLKIKSSIDQGQLQSGLRRLFDVANKLGEERLKRLYDVERASRVRFKLSQLEALCKVEGEKELYTTAASAAGFGVDDICIAEKSREAAYHLDWFPKVFPEYAARRPPEPASIEEVAAVDGRDISPKSQQYLEVHEEGILVAACPLCEGGNLLRLQGEIDVCHLPLDPRGEAKTSVAEAMVRTGCTCSHCGKGFFVLARHLEGGRYVISSSASGRFEEPRERVETLDLRFDFEQNIWQRDCRWQHSWSPPLAAQSEGKVTSGRRSSGGCEIFAYAAPSSKPNVFLYASGISRKATFAIHPDISRLCLSAHLSQRDSWPEEDKFSLV
jgi:hypothetical protein